MGKPPQLVPASMLPLALDDFLVARTALLRKDLLAYDTAGHRYQVLSLPPRPMLATPPRPAEPKTRLRQPPAHVREAIRDLLSRTDPHRR